MPQALIGAGLLLMLAATLVGFVSLLFYLAFYIGAAMVPAGLAWILARNRAPR
jgi:hypothetical protein